jgi:hypothetical protein
MDKTLPRIVALCAFYDEPPSSLATMISGLARLGVDHAVFLDGAYGRYPGGKPGSHPDQWRTIQAAFTYGVGVTLIVPKTTWAGDEVEKRTALFRHGLAHSEPGDWFYVVDADEFVCSVPPPDLKQRLADATEDVAAIHVIDVEARRAGERAVTAAEFDTRRLFRAQPIHVDTNHFTYLTADGRVLWASGNPREEPCLDLTDAVLIEHHPGLRDASRLAAKWAYYSERDRDASERGPCVRCGEPAVTRLPDGWRVRGGQPVGNFAEFCRAHAAETAAANRRQLYRLGFDPDRVTVRERYPPVAALAR